MHIEKDCIGSLTLDDDLLYGIHTTRALHNFPISSEKTNPLIFNNLIQIKKAAALVNLKAGSLGIPQAKAIVAACNQLLLGKYANALVAPAIQGSAGTSVNMNVNEVIAKLAMKLNPQVFVHPNDDVNQSQSTNDVFPTAGKMAMLQALSELQAMVAKLVAAWEAKAKTYADVIKVGRTQLQDAVPTTFGHTFNAYAVLFKRDLRRLTQVKADLQSVNLGGTAIGTGLNASPYYQQNILATLNRLTGLKLTSAPDLMDPTQNCDTFVEFSGVLKTLAVNLSKVSNDLRLMASGPQAGLNELHLPAKQAGSSIMPGKVNPVIPEVVNQVAFEVIGHDVTVGMAAEAGQLELNAFEPIIFRDILQSETYLTRAMDTLITNCITGITVNTAKCDHDVQNSAISATVLTPKLGYARTTALVKEALATKTPIKTLLQEKGIFDDTTLTALFSKASLTNAKQTSTPELTADQNH